MCVSLWFYRDPLICLSRYCGWMLGTRGSFSPWTMRVGQLIKGRCSVQMLPVQRLVEAIYEYFNRHNITVPTRINVFDIKCQKPYISHTFHMFYKVVSSQRVLKLIWVNNLSPRDFGTFWSFCKVWNPVHPALPRFSKDFCSIHLFHGLPHPCTPLGDITDCYMSQQKPMQTNDTQ